MHILVIDDNFQVRKMLCSYLEKNNHHVEMAKDGKQGWDIIAAPGNSFDLIFADIKMPVMNGLELLEKIRKNGYEVPVIIMTGYAVIELTLKAFKLGAYDFLTKPFEFETLLAALNKIDSLRTDKLDLINISQFYKASIQYDIPSRIQYIKSLIPALQNHYKPICDLHFQDCHGIASCLFEAMQNAIIYGNLELDSQLKAESLEQFYTLVRQKEAEPEFGDKTVVVRAEFSSERLIFEIEDKGKGFDTNAVSELDNPESLLPTGRGIFIIKSYMDDVSWNDSGNRITMVKYLRP
ncbi:MAG: response regulator [Proteobacteria bacterium]|nr:response regulator [Pseudomonadota bacterium]